MSLNDHIIYGQVFLNQKYEPYIIHPKNPAETELINTKCIKLYIDRAERIAPIQRVLIFENLRGIFLEEYGLAKNKSKLIELEKIKIEKIKEKNRTGRFPYLFQEKHFDKAFNDFYVNNVVPDLSVKVYEMEELIVINNGYVIAQYSLFLDSLLKKPNLAKVVELTHMQQILILDYLGIGKELSNVKRGEAYSAIIRRPIDNTRQLFSRIRQGKNRNNLEVLLKFFNEYGFKDQAQLVEKELSNRKVHK